MKIYLFLIIFLLTAAFFIISENKLALKNPEARVELGKLYFSWLEHVFDNSKSLAGYIIRLDWLPENMSG